MFDTVFGLPTHVLVVHAAVVLVPIAALAVLLLALRPSARLRPGWWLVAFVAVACLLVPVATQSGEALQERVGGGDLVHTHAELGDQLLWIAAPLPVLAALLVWLERRRRPRSPSPVVLRVVAVLAVVVALATGVQVVRVGHSGATAVWKPIVENT